MRPPPRYLLERLHQGLRSARNHHPMYVARDRFEPRQGRYRVARGEPAVGSRGHARIPSPIGAASGHGNIARVPSRAAFEPRSDVALGGARYSFYPVPSHGWLAVGQMTAPATRAFGCGERLF
jgi:hypothetical protein